MVKDTKNIFSTLYPGRKRYKSYEIIEQEVTNSFVRVQRRL